MRGRSHASWNVSHVASHVIQDIAKSDHRTTRHPRVVNCAFSSLWPIMHSESLASGHALLLVVHWHKYGARSWMYVWMDGGMDLWMYGRTDAWMCGCMDVWTHGCTNVCVYHAYDLYIRLYVYHVLHSMILCTHVRVHQTHPVPHRDAGVDLGGICGPCAAPVPWSRMSHVIVEGLRHCRRTLNPRTWVQEPVVGC